MEEKNAVTAVEITISIIHGGGRAGPHEWGWVAAGYDLDEVESLRLQPQRDANRMKGQNYDD